MILARSQSDTTAKPLRASGDRNLSAESQLAQGLWSMDNSGRFPGWVLLASPGNYLVSAAFGWNRAATPNLVNTAGLSASPFQSSEWQGGTGE